MPDDEYENFQTVQEQIDYLMAQVNLLKVQKSRSLSAIGNQFMLQTGTITTTLSAAITSGAQTSISITAAINITNPGAGGIDYIQIDDEIMGVMAGGGSTTLTVIRGQFGTIPTVHANGAVVDNSLVPYLFHGNPFNQIPERINVDASFATATVGSGVAIMGICHGIYESPKPTTNNVARQVYEFAILNATTGSQIGYPPNPLTTLGAAISSVTATTITVASGSNISNGSYIMIDSEIMRVVGGAGTTTLTVVRGSNLILPGPGQNPSATHTNGSAVSAVNFGYVMYFMIGANGWNARIYATAQYTVVLCTQVGSGIAATVNFTMESVL